MPLGIQVGDLLTIGSMLGALWAFDRRRSRQQALRDQKIDIILLGSDATNPGLVGRVLDLKVDMYHDDGKVPTLARSMRSVHTALANEGITVPEPHRF